MEIQTKRFKIPAKENSKGIEAKRKAKVTNRGAVCSHLKRSENGDPSGKGGGDRDDKYCLGVRQTARILSSP